ncbi:MAG: NAD(P)/FAD-dependent oxidoreductase [Deltaproteobacteria bacterium]|nr:NAD(P)/FAD-dependent oxidoreductase [Candidatus Anaeroferrophillacea bacterium]
MKHLVIGGGIAGIVALETIRRHDSRAAVTVVAAEDHPPYSRPMTSALVAGTASPARMCLRPETFFADLGITAVIGDRVVALDIEPRAVHTAAGRRISFDRLLIAAGAEARLPDVPGADLDGIFPLRTIADAEGIVRVAATASRAVVVGGGLVGCKAALALRHRGLPVTMVITSSWPLSQQLDDAAGMMLRAEMEESGITVLPGRSVAAFRGNGGRVTAAVLDDGRELAAELAVVGKGVVPAADFVSRKHIRTGTGIRVSEYLETSVPGIFAAGDVAETFDLAGGGWRLNAIWPEAAEQGRAAGENMLGRRTAYPGSLARNVIRAGRLDLATAGVTVPPKGETGFTVVDHLDHRRGCRRRLVFHDDRLAGMVLVNRIAEAGRLMQLIRTRRPLTLPPDLLLEISLGDCGWPICI